MTVASQVADHLLEKADDRARSLENLGLVTEREERFDRLTRLARSIFGVAAAHIALLNRDTLWVKSRQGPVVDDYALLGSFCELTMDMGAPLIVEDATEDPRFADGVWVNRDDPIRFYAGIPVRDERGLVLGTFCLTDPRPRGFTAGEFEILSELAGWARQELVASDESRRAREVQRGMLPDMTPQLSGYELAGICEPTSAVGGDLYDWAQLPRGIGIALLDVMGKGTGAAIISAGVRAALRTATRRAVRLAGDDAVPVEEVMADLAVALEPDLQRTATMVTLFLGYLSADDHLLRWTDAGHGLAVVVGADGTVSWLTGGGLPLGVSGSVVIDEGWPALSYPMRPGDTALIFSDGLLDMFGGDRSAMQTVAGIVAACDSAREITALISRLAQRTTPTDDLTALVVRRMPA